MGPKPYRSKTRFEKEEPLGGGGPEYKTKEENYNTLDRGGVMKKRSAIKGA